MHIELVCQYLHKITVPYRFLECFGSECGAERELCDNEPRLTSRFSKYTVGPTNDGEVDELQAGLVSGISAVQRGLQPGSSSSGR